MLILTDSGRFCKNAEFIIFAISLQGNTIKDIQCYCTVPMNLLFIDFLNFHSSPTDYDITYQAQVGEHKICQIRGLRVKLKNGYSHNNLVTAWRVSAKKRIFSKLYKIDQIRSKTFFCRLYLLKNT